MRGPGRRSAAIAVCLAALTLTCAGCSHVLPLGAAPPPVPPTRHLSSAIILQPVLGQLKAPASGCPAGSAALSGPGAAPGVCYRELGKPVTITSAGVSLFQQPAVNQLPAQYQFRVSLPASETAALTAVTMKAVDSVGHQLAIIVAGQAWSIPVTGQPLTQGQFAISLPTMSQALQLQHLLFHPVATPAHPAAAPVTSSPVP
ncbi:MAG TPA: hypothetical protein VGH27_17850 [Streptosporangiaceae bacterium]